MNTNRVASILLRSAWLIGLWAPTFLATGQTPAAGADAEPARTVTSADGTRIAYDESGTGPALILVGGALSDRAGGAELARLLASDFTVYRYDRRGRGDSGDTGPYSVQREIEDLQALIDGAGGSAYVYGKSSGASLALQAAAALGDRITKLAIYEPPYSEADGAAKEWRAFKARLDGLLTENRRADAIALFMAFVGAPEAAVAKLKSSPAWPDLLAMAPTIAYDNAVVGDDRSVPVAIAARVKAATLVMDGGASVGPMPYMRATADKLGEVIPHARRRVIEGQAHDVSANVLAPVLLEFFDRGG